MNVNNLPVMRCGSCPAGTFEPVLNRVCCPVLGLAFEEDEPCFAMMPALTRIDRLKLAIVSGEVFEGSLALARDDGRKRAGLIGWSSESGCLDCFEPDPEGDTALLSDAGLAIRRKWSEEGIEFCGLVLSHSEGDWELSIGDICRAQALIRLNGSDSVLMGIALENSLHMYMVYRNGKVEDIDVFAR